MQWRSIHCWMAKLVRRSRSMRNCWRIDFSGKREAAKVCGNLSFLQYLDPKTRASFLEVVQPQLFEAPSSLSTEAFVNGVIDTIAAPERQTFLEAAVHGALEQHGNLLEAIGYCELMQEGDALYDGGPQGAL